MYDASQQTQGGWKKAARLCVSRTAFLVRFTRGVVGPGDRTPLFGWWMSSWTQCRLLLDGENARCSGSQREEQCSGEDDFLQHGKSPIQVDFAVFCAVPARRCDGYHFYKTCCDFSHTWVTVTRRPRGSSRKPLTDHRPS